MALKKRSTPKGIPQKPAAPTPGFYSNILRSPQSCEFMKASNLPTNYLARSIERRDEIREMQIQHDGSERHMHQLARFQGQDQWCFKKS